MNARKQWILIQTRQKFQNIYYNCNCKQYLNVKFYRSMDFLFKFQEPSERIKKVRLVVLADYSYLKLEIALN
jgi:hypothetical protein